MSEAVQVEKAKAKELEDKMRMGETKPPPIFSFSHEQFEKLGIELVKGIDACATQVAWEEGPKLLTLPLPIISTHFSIRSADRLQGPRAKSNIGFKKSSFSNQFSEGS